MTEFQVGHQISVHATFTDGHGVSEQMSSVATAAVANVNETGSVSITGSPMKDLTLLAQVSDADGVASATYQWCGNGVDRRIVVAKGSLKMSLPDKDSRRCWL